MKYFKTLLLVKSRKYKPDTLVLKLHGHYKCVTSLDFSSCGNYIATGSGDNLAIIYCINLYDIRFKKKILTFKDATNWIYSLCFSHDDKYFATGSIDKISRIYEIDLVEGKQIIKFSFADHLKNISTVKFNSNMNFFASGSHDNSVYLYNFKIEEKLLTSNMPVKSNIFTGDKVNCIEFIQYKNYSDVIAIVNNTTFKMYRISIKNNEIESKGISFIFSENDPIYSISFYPLYSYCVLGIQNRIYIYSLNAMKKIGEIDVEHKNRICSLNFSPDGTSLLSGSWDQQLCIYDTKVIDSQTITIELVKSLKPHKDSIWCVRYNSFGNSFATASLDKTVNIYI